MIPVSIRVVKGVIRGCIAPNFSDLVSRHIDTVRLDDLGVFRHIFQVGPLHVGVKGLGSSHGVEGVGCDGTRDDGLEERLDLASEFQDGFLLLFLDALFLCYLM